jgi:hypothetical protein
MHQSLAVTRGNRPGGLKTPRHELVCSDHVEKPSGILRPSGLFGFFMGGFACFSRAFFRSRSDRRKPCVKDARFCVVHASVMRHFCAVDAP